ncbi:MAG TPA: hypothetical protein VLG10_16805 [Methylomirabilota bacterium]|nr:hypothetical protein [Methylomirabilota bacterium]
MLVTVLAGCAPTIPEMPAADPGPTRAERDRRECLAAAQASLGSDFIIETRARRIVTRPERRVLVTYSSDDELNALLDGLVDHLLGSCLRRRGYEELFGFFILPPRGEGWARDLSRRERGEDIVFTKTGTPGGGVHTALALAGVAEAELPVTGREALMQRLGAELRKEWSAQRFGRVNVDASPTSWLGADCLRYRIAAQDTEVPKFEGQVFTLGVWGLRCVHPDLPRLSPRKVVDVAYSQRFRGTGWQPLIDAEVEPMLTSLIFTSVNPASQVIAALQTYAAFLREVGRQAGAAEVLDQVERFRRSGPGVFRVDPAERLRSYAAVLRGRGREAEARDAEALAAAYLRANFKESLRRYNPPR